MNKPRSLSTGTCLIAKTWPDSLCNALYTEPYDPSPKCQ